MTLTIALDLDGPIYPFIPAFIDWLDKRPNLLLLRINQPSVRPGTWLRETATHYSLTEKGDELNAWWTQWIDEAGEQGVYNTHPPLPEAVDLVAKLCAAGHKVTFITARPPTERVSADTYAWLDTYFPSIPVLFEKEKWLVDFDLILDDNPAVCRAAGVRARFYRHQWNRLDVLSGLATATHVSFYGAVRALGALERQTAPTGASGAQGAAQGPERRAGGRGRGYLTDLPLDDEVRTVSSTGGEKGSKLARHDLVPVRPLELLAEHYGRGARKYEDRNWERGYDWSLSYASLQRHALAFWRGEDVDEETGSPHLVAVAWHAFALLEWAATHPEFDDRPIP